MKKIIVLFFLTAANIASAELQISEDIHKALKTWDANFQVFPLKSFPPTVIGLFRDAKNELPMAVSGDFNGDGQTDFAIMGFNKTQQKIVILVKQEKSYLPVLVNTEKYKDPEKSYIDNEDTGREKGLSTYVSLLSAKDIEMGKKSSLAHKPDALQIENYGGVTTAYYLKPKAKNKFEVKEYKGMINE